MSQSSLAAARKRRAPISTTANTNPAALVPPSPAYGNPGMRQMDGPQNPMAGNAGQGLTLPQVITLVDRRLTNLETQMKGVLENPAPVHNALAELPEIPSNLKEVLDEFNERFEILADELANLKNIVLNLQSYTMDVNKTLLQERIRILGEDTSTEPVSVSEETENATIELADHV
jgi:hypothetical protein